MTAKLINVRKALPGIYNNRNESFTLSLTEDNEMLELLANTEFMFFKMKKGESQLFKKDFIETALNEELFSFIRKSH